ncbi:MAG: hypothetical protein ACLFR8_08765 [Alkalispirochaeta sp.]
MGDGRSGTNISGVFLFGLAVPGAAIPFRHVLQELNEFLSGSNVAYAVTGGVAVARSGSSRTTGDIDVLLRRDEWHRLLESGNTTAFDTGPDWATHRASSTPIDLLFAGDDWDLPFLLPDPEEVREWDAAAGAWFMAPRPLVELKAAVYLSKRREYGEATAAHDLADLSALLTANPDLRADAVIDGLHPSVRHVVASTRREVERYRRKRPKQPPEREH